MLSEAKIDNFREFADRYTNYKEQGLIPKEIARIMQSEYDCKSTCYYNALRICRQRGLVKDSYAETKAAAIKRQKDAARERYNTMQSKDNPSNVCDDINNSDTTVSQVSCQKPDDTHNSSNELKKVSVAVRVARVLLKMAKRK